VRALAALVHSVARARDADEITRLVMDRADRALGCDYVGLYRLDCASGTPTEIHVRHLPDSFVVKYEAIGRSSDKVLARMLATGRATYDEQAFGRDGWRRSIIYRHFGSSYHVRHCLCAPLLGPGGVIGTLNLGRRADEARFDASDRARAERVARLISARLAEIADEGRALLGRLGRQRAERALLRARVDLIERAAPPLPADAAVAAWRALAASELVAVDTFDHGDRRYLLLGAPPPRAPAAVLSRREREVVARASAGASNKVIAADLGLSPSTVATHLSAARAKLGLVSRVGLVTELARGGA
jgi:DNA-binding CsgD family transcriptional regulator